GERAGPQQEGDGEPTEATRASRARLRWHKVLLACFAVAAMAVVAYVLVPRTPAPPSGQTPVAQPGAEPPPASTMQTEQPPPEPAGLILRQLALPTTPATFIRSTKQGNVHAAKLFLAAGMDPKTTDNEGHTALMYATAQTPSPGYTAIIEALLQAKADVNTSQ